jgi:hypothetical protein
VIPAPLCGSIRISSPSFTSSCIAEQQASVERLPPRTDWAVFFACAVPELTHSADIKLNQRLSLRRHLRASSDRIFSPIRTQRGEAVSVILRPAASFSSDRRMPTLEEILQPYPLERRTVGRTQIGRDALMHFAGCDGVHGCCVRDVTNLGAGIRLNGLNIIPSEFGISFDNFRTMRLCRLVWRDCDFVGVTFEK